MDRYKKVRDKYPIISDANQTFYFRAVLHLCNFFHRGQVLYLRNLESFIMDDKIREEVINKIEFVETDQPHIKNLFNLRDKWIAHRDKDWYIKSQIFPDDTFELYLRIIDEILQLSFGKNGIDYDKDLIKSGELLEQLQKLE